MTRSVPAFKELLELLERVSSSPPNLLPDRDLLMMADMSTASPPSSLSPLSLCPDGLRPRLRCSPPCRLLLSTPR